MRKRILQIICGAAVCTLAAVAAFGIAPSDVHVSAETDAGSLAYRLEFSDADDLGANTGDSAYAEADVYGSGFTRVTGPKSGTYGVQFPDSAHSGFTHYFSLPTSVFENAESATVAGWFKVPSDIGGWVPEIGIFSRDNNKALRVDPYAPNARNGYLFTYGNNVVCDGGTGIDINGNDGVILTPNYDRWQHMAYVMEKGMLTIYQNGARVKEVPDGAMDPSLLYSADSVFYIGQNGCEDGHPDYNGAVSDFRIYRKALTADELIDEFSLSYKDFLTAEYTFDSQETIYKENINGYDGASLRPHEWTAPTSDPTVVKDGEESVLRLDGNSAFVLARNNNGMHNGKMLQGHSQMTLSFDVKLNGTSATNTGWERLWDIIVDKHGDSTGYITAMAHHASGSGMELIYGNTGNSQKWVFDSEGVSYVLENDKWVNLTYVFSLDAISVYVDGARIAYSAEAARMRKLTDIINDFPYCSAYFTFGSPVHEQNRRLAADYDNIRLWSCAMSDDEVLETVSVNPLIANRFVTVTLDGKDKIIYSGETFKLPVLDRYGYVFEGWFDNAECDGDPITTVSPVNGAEFYSKWSKAVYSVSYDLPQGAVNPNTVDKYSIDSDDIVFEAAVMPGYTFDGWYIGDAIISGIATGENVGGNITLIGKFTVTEYRVVYFADGGTHGNPEKFTVENAVELTDAYKEGYNFIGWFDAESGGENITTLVGKTSDITLYARYEEKLFRLTVDLDTSNGSFSVTAGSREITESCDVAWSERNITVTAVPVNDSYSAYLTFDGAMVSAGDDGKYRLDLSADGKLAGYFAEKGHKLDVSFDGEMGEIEIDGKKCSVGTVVLALEFTGSFKLTAKHGYYIASIELSDDIVTPEYGTAVYSDKLAISEDTALVVTFASLNMYSVIFDGNGGSGVMDGTTLLWSDFYVLPDCAFVKRGSHCVGWSTVPEGQAEYEFGATVRGLTQQDDPVVLYAVWCANSYTIRYDLCGGQGETEDTLVSVGQSVKLAGSISKTGHSFVGWGITAEGAEIYGAGDSVHDLSFVNGATVILYAKYMRETYTLTLTTDVGTTEVSALFREGVRLSDHIGSDEKRPSGWKIGDVEYNGDCVVFVYGDMAATALYAEDKVAAGAENKRDTVLSASDRAGIACTATATAVAAALCITVISVGLRRRRTIR